MLTCMSIPGARCANFITLPSSTWPASRRPWSRNTSGSTSRSSYQSDALINFCRITVPHKSFSAPRDTPLEKSPLCARNLRLMHKIKLLQSAIDCFRPQRTCLSCTVQNSQQLGHMSPFTDSAWHVDLDFFFHRRVEECNSDVVDAQDTLASLRFCRRS